MTVKPLPSTGASTRQQKIVKRIFQLVVTALAMTFALFPVIWIISASLDPRNTLSGQSIVPPEVTLNNYVQLFNNPLQPYGLWMWNSLKVAIITSGLSILITAFSAYAFSRFRFTGRDSLLTTVFLMQVFPTALLFIAIFLFLDSLGKVVAWLGLNTHTGLIFVYLAGAMGINVWLMKGFLDSVPRDMDEAAKVDGATDWQIFWFVVLPLIRPIMAVIGLLTFITAYSEYLLARTILQDTTQFTLAVGLTTAAQQQFSQSWGTYAAGALIGALPIIVIYLFLQDFIVSGLTEGSVKG
ncbi:MAG: sugar ABC transporter permease [Anaerolineae bacterium]